MDRTSPLDSERLNFHHLRYFWAVAREGSIARACARLHVAQPTISGQIRELERALGDRLFERRGRKLELTSLGRTVLAHADDIFAAARELAHAVGGRATQRTRRLAIGVSDQLPKLAAWRLLEPALAVEGGVHLVCSEDTPRRLFAELAAHDLDLVLSDRPLSADANVRGHSHLLGESGTTFFAAAALEPARLRRSFPRCLDAAPMLLPADEAHTRRALEGWFARHGVRPRTVGTFQDSALMKAFGQAAAGVFPGPSAYADAICRQYEVQAIGDADDVVERFYAVTVERRVTDPAVLAITRSARKALGGR